jgi:hypothetical protein
VMVDVQERQLSPLLAQDNEDGIPKVPDLGEVEQPQEIGQSRIVLAVCNARSDSVSITVGQEKSLNCHVRAKHDLGNVVDKFDRIRIHGRQSLHNLGSNDDEQEIHKCDSERTGEVRQKPSLHIKSDWSFRQRIRFDRKV